MPVVPVLCVWFGKERNVVPIVAQKPIALTRQATVAAQYDNIFLIFDSVLAKFDRRSLRKKTDRRHKKTLSGRDQIVFIWSIKAC